MHGGQRAPAIVGAFAAHFRAELAMFMVVPFAFGGAAVARRNAGFEHRADDGDILARAPRRDACGGIADIGAIEAGADALAHVHRFGHAGIRAGRAEQRAEHAVANGGGQFLVQMIHIGVGGDHLVNGHASSPVGKTGERVSARLCSLMPRRVAAPIRQGVSPRLQFRPAAGKVRYLFR